MNVFDFSATSIDGTTTDLAKYRGKVLLIVNVASRCSFTPQYAGLEELYQRYKDRGFEVLGFPCNQFGGQEPGEEATIREFCSTKYRVTFPMFSKIEVNGPNTHPLYVFLKEQRAGWLGVRRIGWNFVKFLVDREGNVLNRYSTMATPASIAPAIEAALQ